MLPTFFAPMHSFLSVRLALRGMSVKPSRPIGGFPDLGQEIRRRRSQAFA
jgi:hypothetical protein